MSDDSIYLNAIALSNAFQSKVRQNATKIAETVKAENPEWQPNLAVTSGYLVVESVNVTGSNENPRWLRAVATGTTGATEPVWSLSQYGVYSGDNNVNWEDLGPYNEARQTLADAVLNGNAKVYEMSLGVLNNASITADSAWGGLKATDNDIQFALTERWDAFAG